MLAEPAHGAPEARAQLLLEDLAGGVSRQLVDAAIALLALRRHADADANQRSLEVLERLLAEHDSGLALSWSILCLDAYERETTPLRARLEASFAARGFLDDTRSLALAALALGNGAEYLGDPA